MAAGDCGEDPPKEILLSYKGTEDLIEKLESGDDDQTFAAETISELLGVETAGVVSFVTSIWLTELELNLEHCLSAIGPVSHHGGCLLVFYKFEWEGEPIEGFGKVRLEAYDGLFSVYSCYKQHGTTEKNLLVCPEGDRWRIFPGR